MHTGKTYDCRAAMIAAMLAMANGTDKPDLKAILAEHTEIPDDRLDFAVSEMSQLMFGLRQVAKLLGYVSETPEQLRENIEATVAEGTAWTDDDKRDLTVRAFMKPAEGEPLGEPLVTVATKLKAVEGGDA